MECDGTHPATATFAVRADGSFLLAKRAKPGSGLGKWSVPGGRIERGETWQDATARELEEEACLTIREPLLLTATTTTGEDAGWLTLWSMGRCESREVLLNEEASDYAWVSCGDLWRYELWKPHWVPLLDFFGGTTNLDRELRGLWS